MKVKYFILSLDELEWALTILNKHYYSEDLRHLARVLASMPEVIKEENKTDNKKVNSKKN